MVVNSSSSSSVVGGRAVCNLVGKVVVEATVAADSIGLSTVDWISSEGSAESPSWPKSEESESLNWDDSRSTTTSSIKIRRKY